MEDSNQNRDEQSSSHSQSSNNRSTGIESVKQYIFQHKLDTALWATRFFTLIFCFFYIIPIFGSSTNSYYKALMSNAASSALRLHQRIPDIQFTREFLARLIMEDSAHYLFFSIIFTYSLPITMVLVPIFLFALLHFASYSLILLDLMGRNNALGTRFLISLVEYQQRNMLRGAAFVEIFLMPLTVISLFQGIVSLLTPVLYYRFLTMRYSSRRNIYTKTMFYELRVSTEYAINRPFVPQFIRTALYKIITLVSGLAPQYVTNQSQ